MIKGTYVAMVTPFNKDLSIDFGMLREFVDFQIENGIDGLVPCGTTGEFPTLVTEEYAKVVETVVDQNRGRVKICPGAGSNSTQEAIEYSKMVQDIGVDAIMSVCPYYNKPNSEGVYQHYNMIAEAVELPIMVYNIPSRTGINIDIDNFKRIKNIPNIVAVKESSGDIDYTDSLINAAPDLTVLSGNDSQNYPIIAIGGQGVVSVTANLMPREVSDLVKAAMRGDHQTARDLHMKLHSIHRAVFIDGSPSSVKRAMKLTGIIRESFVRPPIWEIRPEKEAELKSVMQSVGIKLV